MFHKQVQEILGYTLSNNQLKQFEMYFEFLIEYNQTTNLTRITEKTEVYVKHFFDSIAIIKVLDLNQITNICDLGSGAGFPSIPLKILYPHLNITIIDALKKRIVFLENLVDKLGLKDVELIHDRVESYAINHLNTFDLVTARALGTLTLILEMGIPLVKVNGLFIAYKGATYQNEIDSAKKAFDTLACEVINKQLFELPNQYGYRANIFIKKTKQVKGYPRTYALMTKKPL